MTPLGRTSVSVLVVLVLLVVPCIFGIVLNRLMVASLCLRDPYPLGQYFFSINFLSLGFIGLLFTISLFSVIFAWPWTPREQSRKVMIKFLGMYMIMTFTVLAIALYLTDSY